MLAPSPHVTMKTVSARGWESVVQPWYFKGQSGPWGSVHHLPIPLGLFPCRSFLQGLGIPLDFSGTLVSLMTLGHHAVLYFFLLIFYH